MEEKRESACDLRDMDWTAVCSTYKVTTDLACCADTISPWDCHTLLISKYMKDCVTTPAVICARQAIESLNWERH